VKPLIRLHGRVLEPDRVRRSCHSVSHPDFGLLDAALRELAESRERLAQAMGLDVREFAIPFGQSRNWTAAAGAAAAEAGYTTVYAQSVDTRSDGTVPRTFITRIDRPRSSARLSPARTTAGRSGTWGRVRPIRVPDPATHWPPGRTA
jgi:hypothetical protein